MKNLSKYLLIIVALIILCLNYYDTCCARYSYRAAFFIGLFLYFFEYKDINKEIYRFLLFFTAGQLVSSFTFLHHFYDTSGLIFYTTNIFFIIAYIFLSIDIMKRLTTNNTIKKYWFSGVVLLCLGMYIWYTTTFLGLFSTINSWLTFYDNLLIMLYMLIVILIFAMSVFNFIINPYNEYILFSFGVVCITFSEIVSTAIILDFTDPITSSLSLGFMFIGFCLMFFKVSALSRNLILKKNIKELNI